jgi:hypothetical protein
VEEPSIVPTGALGTGETPAPALKQRLIQIERSLQNLQRQLQPDASSPQSRKRRREDEEGASTTRFQQHSSIGPGSRLTTRTNETILPSFEVAPNEGSSQTSDNDEEPVVGPNTDNEVLREFISTRDQFRELFDALPAQPPVGSALPLWASPSEGWTFLQYRQEFGERIIGNIPSKAICEDLLRVYFSVFDHIRPCVPQQWADRALREISDLDSQMEVAGSISSKAKLIEVYTSKGPSLCSDPPSLVNWNTVGTLAALFAIAAATAPQLLDVGALCSFTRVQSVHEFTLRMRKVVGMCWELQKPTEYADESTILLLYNYMFMLIVLGEYSKNALPRSQSGSQFNETSSSSFHGASLRMPGPCGYCEPTLSRAVQDSTECRLPRSATHRVCCYISSRQDASNVQRTIAIDVPPFQQHTVAIYEDAGMEASERPTLTIASSRGSIGAYLDLS